MWLPHYLRSPALDGSGVATDPYFSSVVLLAVNDNKGNGTTAFADQSNAARALTANGTIAYSTTSAPTGMTSSATCNGAGAYLSSVNSTDFDFGAGDFTIETMINFSSSIAQVFVAKDNTGVRFWNFQFTTSGGTKLRFFCVLSAVNTAFDGGAFTPTLGNWYHVAVTRSGANLQFWINGSQSGTTSNISTSSIDVGSVIQTVGALGNGGNGVNGFLANTRVTKGVARYTSAFTPPTLPLPTQ